MKTTHSTILLSLLGIVSAQSATIAWTSAPYTVHGAYGQILDTGLFVTTGTQILAENVGGSATTFDGISFTAGTISFGGAYNGFHEQNEISQTGTYGSGGTAGTVNLTGLTTGYTYRIQALVYDGRGTATITGRTVAFDGINQGQYANGVQNVTWGNGLLVTGTFVASASTQSFTIEAFYGGTSKGGQLNTLLVHQTAVPETSSALLGGLGLLALARRRR